MPYYTDLDNWLYNFKFARYAEIMPYYTLVLIAVATSVFARYAEIMPYYTFYNCCLHPTRLLGMLK